MLGPREANVNQSKPDVVFNRISFVQTGDARSQSWVQRPISVQQGEKTMVCDAEPR